MSLGAWRKRWAPVVAWVAAAGALAFAPTVASAQETGIQVATNAPVALTVEGVRAPSTPATVRAGSQVCVTTALQYVAETDRWAFRGWSHGPATECVRLTSPGLYTALYDHEVLFQLRSSKVPSLQKTLWVEVGVPLSVSVPEAVEAGSAVRYRFQQWAEGEKPFSPTNVVAPLGPKTLEPQFVKEYLLTLEGPPGVSLLGSGWHAEGTATFIRASDTLEGTKPGERLKFVSWESVGELILVVPDAGKSLTKITVDAPYTLKATYGTEYFVDVRAPFGTIKRGWVKDGEEVLLDAPVVQEIIKEVEQQVFKGWQGLEGVSSPRIAGSITSPVNARAIYERQVKVTVDAPYGGSGGGWYKVGSTATVGVPASTQSKLIFRRQFEGFPGYGEGKPTVQIPVQEALVITALYSSQVELGVLGMLLGLPLLAVVALLLGRWLLTTASRRAAATRVGEENGSG